MDAKDRMYASEAIVTDLEGEDETFNVLDSTKSGIGEAVYILVYQRIIY